MSSSSVQLVADALLSARRDGQPRMAAAFDNALAGADEAYAVQATVARALGWFPDASPRYWKSGGQSRQSVLTHAPLPPHGVWTSPATANGFPFVRRGIEAEIALRLGRDVDAELAAGLDEAAATELVDAMAVSIEVVDSRWTECMAAVPLLRLADLQCHGSLILGEWQTWKPRDWSRQVCRVAIGSQDPVERCGTHALGTPTWGLGAWLRHITRDGAMAPAGTTVTTGTWVGILDAEKGDLVVAEFDGMGTARVQL
ncbi:fumarylacetoacetate hydrolase family protein [Sinorhizobium arboris]|uniref:fumarylacetoacetate hydrolase family protein n=1 Tax=Sinorhizobium arboris TaxID=76745 RepID=UPI00041807FD|nr:fumarylacetoacetate hydrolase family protein [Sinorhizobium arboris]